VDQSGKDDERKSVSGHQASPLKSPPLGVWAAE